MDRKEAIEVVRKKVDYYEADKRLKAALEALIPELAESEDEKTLGFMRSHFYNLVKLQDENEMMYAKCLVFVTELKVQKAIQDSVAVVAANRPMISKFEAGKAAVLKNPEEYGLCKPAEWSEEDEKVFKRLCDYLENERDTAITEFDTASFAEYVQWIEKRIKPLRPQPHWKPTEEQIKALDKAIPVCMGVVGRDEITPLESLYDDLKKL